MPSVSQAQARYFRWLEHAPDAAAERKKSGMTRQQMHDFSATPDKGLPEYKADGQAPLGGTMTNQSFQQAEQTSGARPEWMERATAHPNPMADGRACMGDGRHPTAAPMPQYRVRATRITAQPLADGKKPEKWAAEAFGNNKGGLHRALKVPLDKKIPEGKLNAAAHSKNAHVRHMAAAARNI